MNLNSNEVMERWVYVQEKKLLSETQLIGNNKLWAYKLYSQAMKELNDLNNSFNDIPPFINLRYREFMRYVLYQYYMQTSGLSILKELYEDDDYYDWSSLIPFLCSFTSHLEEGGIWK